MVLLVFGLVLVCADLGWSVLVLGGFGRFGVVFVCLCRFGLISVGSFALAGLSRSVLVLVGLA